MKSMRSICSPVSVIAALAAIATAPCGAGGAPAKAPVRRAQNSTKRDTSAMVAPVVGERAPDFTVRAMDGKRIHLAAYRNRVVFLNFWASWCPPCRAESPHMEALYKHYRHKGFIVLGVDDEGSAGRAFAQKNFTYPVALNAGSVDKRYGIEAIPTTFAIDRRGVIMRRFVGFGPGQEREFDQAVRQMLGGKLKPLPPEPPPAPPLSLAHLPIVTPRRLWSYTGAGDWTDVSAGFPQSGGADEIYACDRHGQVTVLTADGKPLRTLHLDRTVSQVQVSRSNPPLLVGWDVWGHAVTSYDAQTGAKLWAFAPNDVGVDWVSLTSGEPEPRVIVGYNGGGGLYLLSSGGKTLWSQGDLGNCWENTAASESPGTEDVFTTEAGGRIYEYDMSGKSVRQFNADEYNSSIAAGQLEPGGPDRVLTLGETNVSNPQDLNVFSTTGKLVWRKSLGCNTNQTGRQIAVEASKGGPAWIIVSDSQGFLHPFRGDGETFRPFSAGGKVGAVGSAQLADGSEELLVVTPAAITAYRVGASSTASSHR